MKRLLQLGSLPLLLLALLPFAGCSTHHYRKSADKEAYGAITQKKPLVKNMDEHFTIEQTNKLTLDDLPVTNRFEEFLGPDGATEGGAQVLSLERGLAIAVNQSRTYQFQKEQLFLSALSLTLDRHRFAPIFSAGGSAAYSVTTAEVADYVPDPKDPTKLIPVFTDQLAETRTPTANGQAVGTLLLNTGARLTASFTTDFLRYLSGDPSTRVQSHLLGNLIQPLWRG